MSTFSYTALKMDDNSYIKGEIDRLSKTGARSFLEKNNLLVINMTKQKTKNWAFLKIFSRIRKLDKIHFTRHLQNYFEVGISMNQAIKIAADQTQNRKMQQVLTDIHDNIVKGQSLSDSLRPHDKVFPNYYVKLIKSGEESGTLDNILKHLLEQQEREYSMTKKIKNAMIYPAVILSAAILMIIFMITFIVPMISSTLMEFEQNLPFTTKSLIFISNFLTSYWAPLLLSLFILAIIAKNEFKRPKTRFLVEKGLLSLPVIKTFYIEYNISRFARVLSAPLMSGLTIDKSLKLAYESTKDEHYKQAIHLCIDFVRKGIPISDVLKGFPKIFPNGFVHTLEIGEKTGRTDKMIYHLAKFYEKSIHNTLNNSSSIIEPFLIVIIGFVVGYVAMAVLLPIWSIAEII